MAASVTPAPSRLSRRSALTLAAAGLPAVAGVAALSGCGIPDRRNEPAAQRLTVLIGQARDDAAAAAALAPTVTGRTAALRLVADQRTAHAAALTDELSRFLEQPAPALASSAAPVPGGSLDALRTRLTASARTAGDAAVADSGRRASLLGAVAAATATHAMVVLA